MRHLPLWLPLALALTQGSAATASITGIRLPDEVGIGGLDRPLLLNGAGMPKKFFVGDDIVGDDFNPALAAVRLGPKPLTQALKNGMVGVDKD